MSLGKITRAEFGFGGYQEAMIGIEFTLTTPEGSVDDFWGTWSEDVFKSKDFETPENLKAHIAITDERSLIYADTTRKIASILQEAKVHSVSKLVGKPVEVIYNGQQLSSWRILKEVL